MDEDTFRKVRPIAIVALLTFCCTTTDTIGEDTERWQAISAVRARKTHLVPGTWTLDKYPNAPTLEPHHGIHGTAMG